MQERKGNWIYMKLDIHAPLFCYQFYFSLMTEKKVYSYSTACLIYVYLFTLSHRMRMPYILLDYWPCQSVTAFLGLGHRPFQSILMFSYSSLDIQYFPNIMANFFLKSHSSHICIVLSFKV